jgi:hypothetical protein
MALQAALQAAPKEDLASPRRQPSKEETKEEMETTSKAPKDPKGAKDEANAPLESRVLL